MVHGEWDSNPLVTLGVLLYKENLDSFGIQHFGTMPWFNPNFLVTVFTTQNLLGIFQLAGRTIIEIIIIYPSGNRFWLLVL